MNLKQAMQIREEVAKDFLTDIFAKVMSPDEVDQKIAIAYQNMENRWEDRLRTVIGPQGVAQVLKDLERPVSPL